MCGICGIYDFDREREVDPNLVQKMCGVLTHRGPDQQGRYLNGNVGLGILRLSIIDLVSGDQPIHSEDRSRWIVFNGEIYNYQEISEFLRSKGHSFYTRSDTEVILHAYEEFGEACVQKLNGMFAFAIWDGENQRMFLARDRLGIKPLFYHLTPDKLLFGSEIKAILADPTVKREVDHRSLHSYLSLNYMPAPQTMFRGIHQLLPGHSLTCTRGQVSVKPYWDLRYSVQPGREDRFYMEGFEERLTESIRRRLISDVPLGAFLSGGLDSSSIVAIMSRLSDRPVKTFSIGFEDKSYNELPYARMVSQVFRTEHHELVVKPDMVALLPKLVWHAEEPTADSSAVPVYYVSKLAREHVKVVLSGDGADELCAGYETYMANRLARAYRKLPPLIRKQCLFPLIMHLPVSTKKYSFEFKAKRFLQGVELSPEEAHFSWRLIFTEAEKRDLYTDQLREELEKESTFRLCGDYFLKAAYAGRLNQALYVDTRFYLPNDMLVKVDRMSMANSLEARVPFLDHELVEFAATLPDHLKLRGITGRKHVLRRVMQPHLPAKIVNRRKGGFNIPVADWITNDLREFVQDTLTTRVIREAGWFNPDTVQRILHDHFRKARDNGHKIWGLVVLFLWWNLFVRSQHS